jgi:sulfotransferase
MFNVELLTNEVVKKIDCPGCFDHAEVSLSDGSGRSCVMIQKYMDKFAERVKKMEIYEDDVWVVTFPKCGTTWTVSFDEILCENLGQFCVYSLQQEMVWMINNYLNYKTARAVNLNDRFPFLE